MWFHRFFCAGAASIVIAAVGCSNQEVKLAYVVSESQAVGSVSLFGTTLAVLGNLSVFPDQISAANYPPPCMLDAATPETGHSLAVSQVCEHVESGRTSCHIQIDARDCSVIQGVAEHAPIVFTVGEGAKSTLKLSGFKQISPSGGEIQFDGTVEITSTSNSFSYAEAQTVIARPSTPGAKPTELDVISSYVVDIAADKLTVNGAGTYTVNNLGANSVVISDLVIPIDDSCEGPTSGSLQADLITPLGSALEGFAIAFSACNTATLIRYKNGVEKERAPLPVSTVVGMFAATYDAIKSIALTAQNAQPAASAPFDAEQAVTALDPADTWCRFLQSENDLPFVASISAETTPGAPVAECLSFAADVTLVNDPATTNRAFLATVLSIEGALSDGAGLRLLGAQSGAHGWNAATSTLAPILFLEHSDLITADVFRDHFQAQAAAALTSVAAALSGPFMEAPFLVTMPITTVVPNFDCIDEIYAPDSLVLLSSAYPQEVTAQCDPQFPAGGPTDAFTVEFSRLGMWLIKGSNQGLYYRVVQ